MLPSHPPTFIVNHGGVRAAVFIAIAIDMWMYLNLSTKCRCGEFLSQQEKLEAVYQGGLEVIRERKARA